MQTTTQNKEKDMKISAEVAAYMIKLDTHHRGYPLKPDEIKYCVNHIRQVSGKYTMLNGDLLIYKNQRWSIHTYASYRESLRQSK